MAKGKRADAGIDRREGWLVVERGKAGRCRQGSTLSVTRLAPTRVSSVIRMRQEHTYRSMQKWMWLTLFGGKGREEGKLRYGMGRELVDTWGERTTDGSGGTRDQWCKDLK